MDPFFKQLQEKENLEIKQVTPLFGGSINNVYLLDTSKDKRVIKVNNAQQFPRMFEAEKEGLNALRNTNSIGIPKVFASGQIGDMAYLLMEYIPKGQESKSFWNQFAQELSELHQNTQPNFGLKHSNYIGSLKQENNTEATTGEFYIHQRIKPQVELAEKNGFQFKNKERLFTNISAEIPDERSALIHGDLWSGNYLVSENGKPYLIDPAVSYGPREMDLSMMKLFGGFPDEVFSIYNEVFPLKDGFESRIQLWQLYYLLVHLNLFGGGYLSQVKSIMDTYN